ncbi:gigantic extracellular protein [Cryptosporidium canis]|uniref:Gigantic extracellular protein n=1 Tax=Cryptosporidium canis TaxID=195482 RepID=A0ABQ8P9Z0_9CRYT|nr:gigantic extracellular protein [Cryptosporidium canis]
MPWKAPKNGKAVWNGGERKQFYIYYSILDSEANNGTWVIDRDLDSTDILSFAESVLPDPNNYIPPDGKTTMWKKWVSINPEDDPEWIDHPDVSILCRSFPEKTSPSLIAIHPPLGSVDVAPSNTEIKLTFNRPMNYGHWAWFNITGRTTGHLIHIPTDFEAKYRGLSVISNQTSEVILRPYESLVEGEVYDITVELGALTDLTYQPWGNVGPNQLFFTTSGESCRELDLLSFYDHQDIPRYQLEYSHSPRTERESLDYILFPPGTNAKLKCSSGYSTKRAIIQLESPQDQGALEPDQEGSFGCVRGKWQQINKIHCYQKCKPYPISSSSSQNYIIQSSSSSGPEDQESEYLHGSKLQVKCVGTNGSEVIKCKDGIWTALTLICGTSCPPYSLPNENYEFKHESDRVKHTPESEITVSCTRNSDKFIQHSDERLVVDKESREFKIACSEGRWESEHQYKCLRRCVPLSESALDPEKSVVIEYDNEIRSGYLRHGSIAKIKCSEDWSPVGETRETSFGCYDGSWLSVDETLSPSSVLTSSFLPDKLRCERKCKDLEIFSNKSYRIESLSLDRGFPGSRVRISCERDFGSVQIGTRTSDVIECLNGVWGIPKTICMSHCESPEEVLGKAYSVNNELGSVKRKGLYFHGTRLIISCSDQGTLIQGGELHQTASCTNGEWIFDNVLICASKCSTLKLPARYLIRSQNSSDLSADTGDTRIVACARPGNSDIEEAIVCRNGEWKPSVPTIDCYSNCPVEDLEPLREFFEILGIGEERRSISHGETIKIRCKKGYVRKTGPLRDLLRCNNGVFEVPTLICERPSCFDGIQNQGEFGVDCGGVCERSCPDTCFDGILNGDETSIDCGGSCGTEHCPKCNDGIKNGDETGVDCGGSQCPTCEPCHGFPLSSLPEGTILSVDGGFSYIEDIQKESLLIDNMAIASGSELHIRCIPGWEQDESLRSKLQILACNDGKWSLPGPDERIDLKCGPPSCDDGIRNGDEWGVDCGGSCESQCSSCSDGVKNGDETGVDCGGATCRKCNSCDSEFIWRLETSGRYTISGNSLREEAPSHGSRLIVGCPTRDASVTLICNDGEWVNRESVRSLPCGRNGLLKASQATNMIEEDLLNIPLDQFPHCHQNLGPCCDLVRRFSQIWGGECGTMYRQGRDTTIKTFCKGKCMSQLRDSLNQYRKAVSDPPRDSQKMGSEVISMDCIAAKSISVIIESHLCQYSDLKSSCSFSFHETLQIVNDPSILQSQPKTLKQICERDSCHRKNLRLIQALSNLSRVITQKEGESVEVKSDVTFVRRQHSIGHKFSSDHQYTGFNMNEDFWRQIILSQTEKSLNLLCLSIKNPSNPKERYSCIKSVSEIITSDRSSVTWLLSLVQEKEEGRKQNLTDMCLRNLPEDSCLFFATRVFGQLLIDVGSETNNIGIKQAGLLYRSFGRYFCQEAKNNRFCGQFLFGGIRSGSEWWESFRSLTFGNISQRDVCSPYHLNFGCSPHCKKKLLDQLNSKGCCFAAQLEIQREILGMEADTSKLNTERSVDYLEQRCGFSLDRVCSSGVKTDLIILEFIFKNINFFEISNSIQEELLRNSIRETISSFLSIPISDIPRIRAWPGSYVVEVLIDSGLSSRTVLLTLEEGLEELAKELNRIDSLDTDFGIKVSKSIISHSRSLSTSVPPPPPFVGTFDMDSLTSQLDFPSCPKPSLGILGIEDQEDGYEISGDNSLKQGAFRNVACSYYFHPVSPSPASQVFICDNGRWRITQHEEKILCKKACKSFNLVSLSLPDLGQSYLEEKSPKHMYTKIGYGGDLYSSSLNSYQSQMSSPSFSQFIVSGVGNDHGSTRSISCSAGYVSDNPDIDSGTFQCINGKWESQSEKTFNCVKGAEASLKYCRASFLSNVLGTEKFMVEEQFDLSSKPEGWKVFKITCSRGYESKIEPVLLACSNGNFYNIPGDTVTISKSNDPEFVYNLILKTVFGGTYSENINFTGSSRTVPKVPSISFSRSRHSFQEEMSSELETSIFSIIECAPKQVMKLSESKGLSGPALYAILFAPLILGMLILAILFWFRRYRWSNSERDTNVELSKQTLAILDVKRKNMCDIETASPSSEVEKVSNQDGSLVSKTLSPPEKKHSRTRRQTSNTLSTNVQEDPGKAFTRTKERKMYKDERAVPEGRRNRQRGVLL